MDKYRPCPSIIAMFTSDSQHPPRSRHAVYLGVKCRCQCYNALINSYIIVFKLVFAHLITGWHLKVLHSSRSVLLTFLNFTYVIFVNYTI